MCKPLSFAFEEMKADHEQHLRRLRLWRDTGGTLDNYPEGETLDDFIAREILAIESLSASVEMLKAKGL